LIIFSLWQRLLLGDDSARLGSHVDLRIAHGLLQQGLEPLGRARVGLALRAVNGVRVNPIIEGGKLVGVILSKMALRVEVLLMSEGIAPESLLLLLLLGHLLLVQLRKLKRLVLATHHFNRFLGAIKIELVVLVLLLAVCTRWRAFSLAAELRTLPFVACRASGVQIQKTIRSSLVSL